MFPSELDHRFFMSTQVTLIAFAYIYKICILLFQIICKVKSKEEYDRLKETKLMLNKNYKFNGEECNITTKKDNMNNNWIEIDYMDCGNPKIANLPNKESPLESVDGIDLKTIELFILYDNHFSLLHFDIDN